MPCNCGQRRQNLATATAAMRRGDYATVRQQTSQFAKSSAQDLASLRQAALQRLHARTAVHPHRRFGA